MHGTDPRPNRLRAFCGAAAAVLLVGCAGYPVSGETPPGWPVIPMLTLGNWELVEARLAEDRYMLSLRMRRFHSGGDGEARALFHRRARELAQLGGFAGYEVLSFAEGIDSSLPFAQRVGEGVVRLTLP
jgi:hypothetical protein